MKPTTSPDYDNGHGHGQDDDRHHHSNRLLLLAATCRKTPSSFHRLHAQFITSGVARHSFPLSRLLLLLPLCIRRPSLPSLLYFLQHAPPSTFLSNTLTSSLAATGHTLLALSLYSRLFFRSHLRPNPHTFPSLLKACAADAPRWAPAARALHAHALKHDAARDPFVCAALLAFYARLWDLAACRRVFDMSPEPDLPTWNSMLSTYARHCGHAGDADSGLRALLLFRKLQLSSRRRPNEITLVALIGACGDLGALSQGAWVHAFVGRSNELEMNRFVATALIEMYSKCGRLDLAEQLFDVLPQKDKLCYDAMIRGLAVHGHGRKAIELFGKMRTDGIGVDDVTLLIVMSACAHCGMVDEGCRIFYGMSANFGVEPKGEHYGCLVDLLGRSGLLEKAEDIINSMPMTPNAAVYRSLLCACRVHDNAEMAERLMKQLIQLEPEHGGNYVLLSNMYAKISRWDDVRKARKAMKDNGIKKTPGCSLVEMGGCMHEFFNGDRRHPLSDEIYAFLDEMDRVLHEFGYRPITNEVLLDM